MNTRMQSVLAPSLLSLMPFTHADVEFQRDVLPVLEEHCLECHGADQQSGELRLDSMASAYSGGGSGEPGVIPGDSSNSELFRRIVAQDDELRMPAKAEALKPEQIALIRNWIDQGAAWSGDSPALESEALPWAFQAIEDPKPPNIDSAWIETPIDAFILEQLELQKLEPSASAARVDLVRRLFLDLHGLLPTPAQVQAFVDDPRPDAWEHWVEQALASPRYGERWAQHWLDLVQYADSHGFEMNNPRPNAFRYRDYVIDAFNNDLGYDRFIREQLAGDTLDAQAATGFLVAGAWDQVVSKDPVATALTRQDELAAMVNTTGTALLGLTLGCARCHNHKFDPVPQRDFYALTAVFAGVRHGERVLDPEAEQRHRQTLADVDRELSLVRDQTAAHMLDDYRPTIMIDDESAHALSEVSGYGEHPEGSERGYRGDLGDSSQSPNVSNGRYSWWSASKAEPLMTWHPNEHGSWKVWLSWGCGWESHASDARYILDRDGSLETTADQSTIAVIDQVTFADKTGGHVGKALWSGFHDAGVHQFDEKSVILLRAGESVANVTADVIVLQEPGADAEPRFRSAVSPRQNQELFPSTVAHSLRMRIAKTNTGSEPCIDELEVWSGPSNVALTAAASSSGDYQGDPHHKLEHINDGLYGNSHSWISNEAGRGWIQLDFREPVPIERVSWARDRNEVYADRTAVDYVIETADGEGRWTLVAASHDRLPFGVPGGAHDGSSESRALTVSLEELKQQKIALASVRIDRVYAGTMEQPSATHRLSRGDPTVRREEVAPNTVSVLGSLELSKDTPEQERRSALARWITAPENPLTARVIVNRLWQHHFGNGLVATASDFGGNGSAPSHPHLLDWLASRLIEDEWSLKSLHRRILHSKTYRQSSEPRPAALAKDAQARLLWRFPPRRLEAEVLRDCILQVSGKLDLTMYGPGFSTFEANDNYVRVYRPKETTGPDELRRMVYMHKVRMEREPVFGAFDRPDAGQVCAQRSRSTTAIQALNLFNSNFVMEQALAMAEGLLAEDQDPVARAYVRAYGRLPNPAEASAAKGLVERHGLVAFCRAILNSNELLFLP